MSDGDFFDLGECKGADAALWYPDWQGEPDDGTKGAPVELYDEAKAVCRTCPVRNQCLEYALSNKERYGCWGGLAPIERLRIERKHRRQRLMERRRGERREVTDEGS